MSERRVTQMMARQYADLLADVDMFGDMQSSAYSTPDNFEAMRKQVLGKIRTARRLLRECENQVKLLQLTAKEDIHAKG